MADLFSPLTLGAITAPNRIFMAPLTRCRASGPPHYAPHALNAEYYRQRAAAGLIISEATQISPGGMGYPNTPGIHSAEQTAGWKLVTDAVHRAGGRMFAQLWHVGRVSHNAFQPGGLAPLSSSAVGKSGDCVLPDGSKQPYPAPRQATLEDIAKVMRDYRVAAENAKAAGFDGVELHGANGYLPDQFLRDGVNKRTDRYGGTAANRARFHLEATQILVDVWGPGRVGVRLSPSGTFNDMSDSNPRDTFGHLVRAYNELPLAYLHIMEAMEGDIKHGKEINPNYEQIPVSFFKPLTRHPVITNSGFTYEKATEYLAKGWADAVAFGIPFISNPDLVARFKLLSRGENVPLQGPDFGTFYWGGVGAMEKGYTDFAEMKA